MAPSTPTPPRGPHVVGLFATREQAEDALDELIVRDFPSDQISVVSAEGKPVSFPTAGEQRRDTAVRDTAIGVTLGGVAGLLIAGPLLLLTGAVVGGAIGLLTALGATQQQAEHLTEQVRSGRYLVMVHGADREAEATSILENAGASEVHRVAE
jgi:gas vesicle protein